jgi:hypothetical protein
MENAGAWNLVHTNITTSKQMKNVDKLVREDTTLRLSIDLWHLRNIDSKLREHG